MGFFHVSYLRLAEIYLNYAEACNEKPARDAKEALVYINKIRERAGLGKLENAYPAVVDRRKSCANGFVRNEWLNWLLKDCVIMTYVHGW